MVAHLVGQMAVQLVARSADNLVAQKVVAMAVCLAVQLAARKAVNLVEMKVEKWAV